MAGDSSITSRKKAAKGKPPSKTVLLTGKREDQHPYNPPEAIF